ncbi:uncharacterized protein LOC126656016 isoform X2 [Mercurialis annua]|uniref:uncharacterized protein LOC126656016 isoform X2 n=1 Tax=Mercurialis annua TaxID=3986 RepID=UPI00215E881F|nr:uncharacterized protein LOC126656016 isoform X2 [Mercurialis annua]
MDAQDHVRYVTVGGDSSKSRAICKCGEGYKCVITRIIGPDAGKTYSCNGNCTCIIGEKEEEDLKLQEKLESLSKDGAYCESGEGWSCIITKNEGSDAVKPGFECAGDCSCVIAG